MKERGQDRFLGDFLISHNIDLVLFDLDGTVLDTGPVFQQQMQAYVDFVVKKVPQLATDHVGQNLRGLNTELYKTQSVSSQRWVSVAEKLGHIYGPPAKQAFIEGLPLLMQIYTTSPPPFPGAIDTLKAFQNTIVKTGLVTHAEENWTHIKIWDNHLENYFDDIRIVSEHDFKGPEHWQASVTYFGTTPKRTMVIGDNLAGDIIAAHKIGVKYKVWLPNSWSVYSEGDEPKGTIPVKSITEVIPTLLALS